MVMDLSTIGVINVLHELMLSIGAGQGDGGRIWPVADYI